MRIRHAAGAIFIAPMCIVVLLASAACSGALPFHARPAVGFTYGSGAQLRVGVIDETQNDDWRPAIAASLSAYGGASRYLSFQSDAQDANIVVTVRRYTDDVPPTLPNPFGVRACILRDALSLCEARFKKVSPAADAN